MLIHLLLFSGVLAGTESTLGAFLAWGVLGNLIDVFFIVSGFLLFLRSSSAEAIPAAGAGGWRRAGRASCRATGSA